MRLTVRRVAVPVVVLALIGWCFWPESDEPAVPVDRAQQQIEAELTAVAGAFQPGLQWTEAGYGSEAYLTGFCGTAGCKKTGRGALSAGQVARVRITPRRWSEPLDVVQALWSGKGYSVRREGGSVEVNGSRFSLRFDVDVNGCARLEASVFDVVDTTGPDGYGGFTQGPKDSYKECATIDDPYWSH
ncbi:hypothetical protein [Kitasatospora sp. NPDC056181]|uniref:hypothetical protein n=1 Tax=Kitasatospora sp. NPDC056181 TaxID=3345737 RepID=UPI0035DB316C